MPFSKPGILMASTYSLQYRCLSDWFEREYSFSKMLNYLHNVWFKQVEEWDKGGLQKRLLFIKLKDKFLQFKI